MKQIVISALLLSLLSACASDAPKKPDAATSDQSSSKAVVDAGKPAVPPAPAAMDPLDDPKSGLANRSVYYPFDIAVVQSADKPLVEAHGKYLSSNGQRTVKLEGNCDERGSNEYNLGLGQRRADGVKKMLVLNGAKESQLSSASYGEEKPRCTAHNEECWAQNRRTDINYAK